MPSGNSTIPGDDYFNDLGQSITNPDGPSSGSPNETTHSHANNGDGPDGPPRPKRIACVICRKRKLKCDGNKPSCGTCSRLGHECAYDQVRRKSGPKRGYVKALEARLAQVENLLKRQEPQEASSSNGNMVDDGSEVCPPRRSPEQSHEQPGNAPSNMQATSQPSEPFQNSSVQATLDPVTMESSLGGSNTFTWEMMSMGIDEPMPLQDVIDELTQIYFEKMHPSIPIIHRRRFLAAMNLTPHARPPVCLRYAMWCLAASVTDKYVNLPEIFYHRARKYIEQDEMKGHGQSVLTVAHCQTWSIIGMYEFKMMYFPKAWLSTGRATRLAQMMGLHRLDGTGLDVKQCLMPPRDWTEREERRRTFWMAFCADRYASIGTGWPMTVEEKDILSNLPASEEAFDLSIPQRTLALKDAMTPSGAASLSPFAGVILMASLFGRNLLHLHRPDEVDGEDDLNGEFWKRHRTLHNILLNTSLSLPNQFRLPNGLSDSKIVFLNMNIHTSSICLHQAAIFKADKNRLPPNVSAESKVRCITAAKEIAGIMRMISHVDPVVMHPFLPFCLYVAARVFVQYLKNRPDDQQVAASMQFLLSAMQTLKRKNPLTESFLVQLTVDMEGSGLDDPAKSSTFAYGMKKGVAEIPTNTDTRNACSPLFEPRQSQAATVPIYPSGPVDPIRSNIGEGAFSGQQHQVRGPSPQAAFDLPSRQKPSLNQQPRMVGIFPTQSTSGPVPNLSDTSPGSGEMDLSPGPSTASSNDNRHQHPSPVTTNASHSGGGLSSRTSFTPSSYDENGGSTNNQQATPPQHQSSVGYTFQHHQATNFASTDSSAAGLFSRPEGQYMPGSQPPPTDPTAIKDTESSFVLSSEPWHFDTGMTPDTEGMFTQMMEVAWDDSAYVAAATAAAAAAVGSNDPR
ncbi:MAG: hypothetical protein M1816_002008 [Peltula sp. TS41687]|nr:MAG: hypothetical protein M1816_002008 [Peltula sp. TS41687]